MSKVNLPVVGSVPKGWIVFVGGGSVIAIWYFVHKKNAAAAQAAAASSTTPSTSATGFDPNAIDPNTGLPYSQEMGNIDPATGLPYGIGSGGTTPVTTTTPSTPGPTAPTTNGQWFQSAETYLSGIGINNTHLSAALGKYLTGQPLTSDQKSLVDQAIASQGYPPQSGPNGYPPKMHVQVPGGQKGGGGNTKTVEAPGGKRLAQLAPEFHTTYNELRKLNPAIAKKFLGRDIPKGTKLIVPA